LPTGTSVTYTPQQLASADYPGLIGNGERIQTVGVAMVMVAASLSPTGERYRNVANFVDAFFARLPQLQAPPHHPKWTEVKLTAELPGWKRFAPAISLLERQATSVATAGEGANAPPATAAFSRPPTELIFTILPGGTTIEMVSLPGGSFLMGSDDDESEKPIHRVAIAPLAIARDPVTVGQWKVCVAAKGCPEIAAEGGDDAPMTNVSWDDAQHFVMWLQAVTKEAYRLPSEAEWEYAARGGTRTRYWWGNQMVHGLADCRGCGGSFNPHHVVQVAAFPPNPFGLNDMAGTVAEWVADCSHKNYEGAPTTNAAWESGDCRQHMLRGGSWQNDPSYLRTSSRDSYDTYVRYLTHGFRPALSQDGSSTASVTEPKGGSR
jgi:formylglycine-generating enzyme required for sulfatase activity